MTDLSAFILNADEVAELLSVNVRTIQRWVKEDGFPKIGRNQYGLKQSVHWYVAYAKATTSKNLDARKELILVQTENQKLEIAKKRGELIAIEEVQHVLNEMAVIYSSQLDGLGARMANILAGIEEPSQIERHIRDECQVIRSTVSRLVEAFGAVEGGSKDTEAAA